MDLYDAYCFVDEQIGLLEEELADNTDKAKEHFIGARLDNFRSIQKLLRELDRRRQGIL
jgi:hypothetical protein